MILLEIIGEIINPKPAGTIDIEGKPTKSHDSVIPIKFIISLFMIGAVEYWLITNSGTDMSSEALTVGNVNFFIYLVAAYFLNVKPDYDNLGWIPFIINNPFRISDNINRFLVFLKLFLMPGRFISRSVVTFILEVTDQQDDEEEMDEF